MSESLSTIDNSFIFSEVPESLRSRVFSYWQDLQVSAKEHDFALNVGESRQRQLFRVWASSDFVAKNCIHSPALIRQLLESGDLDRPYEPGELTQKIGRVLVDVEDIASLQRILRRFRLSESVRIAWRDLAGLASLNEIMATMSELADCCIQQGLHYCYRWLAESRGAPLGKSDGGVVAFLVLGLGKLGGRELNFSSDIDLIFAYGDDGETDAQRPITNHEFFTKLGRQLISILDTRTEHGYVFRVDMRLRPNGRSGPLVLSFDATENYYQTHGRDWERYALIKARVVAGDHRAGEELLSRLRPFVYRKYLDYGAFESIRDMKELVERELARKSIARNIKLGRGGIREIEFIVQSFQLIRGGREPRLQTNRLFDAIDQLINIDALDHDVVSELKSAYVFLRNLEHRLQMVADQQTHVLPESTIEQTRIAYAMGHKDWPNCEQHIRDVLNTVHRHFEQVFVTRGEYNVDLSAVQDVWIGTVDNDTALRTLAEIGYVKPKEALRQLQAFRYSSAYHVHSNYGRQRMDRLMPLMIHQAASTENPNQTLHRLLQLVESIGRRSAYLVLLVENPLALTQLVKLSAASAWISTWISLHPILLDELLDPISTSLSVTTDNLENETRQRLASVDENDLETQMEALREVRHAQTLKVAAADVLGHVTTVDVGHQLCLIAEVMLATVVCIAERGLRAKYGEPSKVDEHQTPEFGVVAYGKLGSLELGYHSDLDLVFLHDGARPQGATQGAKRSIPNQQYYARLGQRIVHILTTRTATGFLYEIDTRLRPSGKAGTLVTSLDAYSTYQRQRAWTWEHQALVRARMVTGGVDLRHRFEGVRHEVLTQKRRPEALKEEILGMRKKMLDTRDRSDQNSFDLKQGKGGIVDIEFIVQYYVLRWAHAYPDLTGPRNSLELLDKLGALDLVSSDERQLLTQAYRRYLAMEHRLKLAERSHLVEADDLRDARQGVTRLWQRVFEEKPT